MYAGFTYQRKTIKNFFYLREIFFPEYLQNLKQGRALYSAYYTKYFFQYSQWFGSSSFPPYAQLLDSRTVYFQAFCIKIFSARS